MLSLRRLGRDWETLCAELCKGLKADAKREAARYLLREE